MDDFDRGFNSMKSNIKTIGCFVVIIQIIAVILIGIAIFFGVKAIRKHGLKNIAESVWNGEGTNAPAITQD